MQPIEAHQRFEYVSIDVTTITPATKEGFCKLLIIVDRFSRFVVAVPMKNEAARTCAEAFVSGWVSIFGPPVKLLSDRAPVFVNGVLKWTSITLGIAQIFTSAYCPSTNRMVERLNQTALREIKAQVLSVQSDDWVRHVPTMTPAYSSSKHAATGFSPFFAMFGVEPLDFNYDIAAAAMAKDEANGVMLADHMLRVSEIVLQSSRRAASAAKRWYDSKVVDLRLTENSHVMVFAPGETKASGRKLVDHWSGPYRIVRIITSQNVVLRRE